MICISLIMPNRVAILIKEPQLFRIEQGNLKFQSTILIFLGIHFGIALRNSLALFFRQIDLIGCITQHHETTDDRPNGDNQN
ncbi:hypothetical protein SRABI89_02163 [Pseudomonas koreensis]|nr:hypothetical protein SRABI89_02163 [Pseudomonas koreensis]